MKDREAKAAVKDTEEETKSADLRRDLNNKLCEFQMKMGQGAPEEHPALALMFDFQRPPSLKTRSLTLTLTLQSLIPGSLDTTVSHARNKYSKPNPTPTPTPTPTPRMGQNSPSNPSPDPDPNPDPNPKPNGSRCTRRTPNANSDPNHGPDPDPDWSMYTV